MQEEHGFWRQRMEQDKREKELMNATQTSDCGPAHPNDSREGSPRIGTSNQRPALVQCQSAVAEEVPQLHAADPVQQGRNERVVQNASQTRKSVADVPRQSSPCARPHGRAQGTTDVSASARKPLPPSGRQFGTRHTAQVANVELGSMPVRRCDDIRPAACNASHTSQSGSVAQVLPSRAGAGEPVVPGAHQPKDCRRHVPGRKASGDIPETDHRAGTDQARARQLQSTGKRHEYIATGEVAGVPVHTRADHSGAASSRTSSADLHTIPKVEHVSHVKISIRNQGVSSVHNLQSDSPVL